MATPVTTPVDPTTVATAVLPLLHVPPPVASLSVVVGVPEKQRLVLPVIADTEGNGLIVITFVTDPTHAPLVYV